MNYKNNFMDFKKHGLILIALTTFVGLTSGISALDINVQPDEPRYNESVNVTAFIDGEGRTITTVDLEVRENNELIVDNEPMEYVIGDERDISSWIEEDAFTTGTDNSTTYEYDITVRTTDDAGNTATRTGVLTVSPDTTTLEPVSNGDSGDELILGLTLFDIFAILTIVGFMYVIFVK